LQCTVGSQYKLDSNHQALYTHCHNAGHPQSRGRSTWVEASSSPLLFTKFIPLVAQVLYSVLCLATNTLLPCWSDWLRKTFTSICREGYLVDQLNCLSKIKAVLWSLLCSVQLSLQQLWSLPVLFPEHHKHFACVHLP